MEFTEEYRRKIEQSMVQIEIEMGQITKENRTLEESIRLGTAAQNKLDKNKKRLKELSKVYVGDDLEQVRSELKLLKNYLSRNDRDEFLVSSVSEIEQLLEEM